jgi:hypothetical protein
MRTLEERLLGQSLHDKEIESNNTWIKQLEAYPDLFQYVVDHAVKSFERCDPMEQIRYLRKKSWSYFSLEEKNPDEYIEKLSKLFQP